MENDANIGLYSHCEFGGRSFHDCMLEYPTTTMDREIIAYSMVHITLSYFHLNGLFLTQTLFDRFLTLISKYDAGLTSILPESFF